MQWTYIVYPNPLKTFALFDIKDISNAKSEKL